MPYPDFLCIGAQKAGTTWLQSMLEQRPDIFMGPFKEYQYFNSLFVPRHRAWTAWHVANSVKNALRSHVSNGGFDVNYIKRLVSIADKEFMFTEEWYQYIFNGPGALNKLRGDVTPEYSTLPLSGVRYVKDKIPNAKVIYIIRDPVDRAKSQIRMNVERGQVVDGDYINWDVLNRGDYKSYICRWDQVFGDQVMYIPYRHLSQRPMAVLREIENHLDLPFFEYKNSESRVHVSKASSIPDDVSNDLQDRLSEQYTFLRSRFGEEFVENI